MADLYDGIPLAPAAPAAAPPLTAPPPPAPRAPASLYDGIPLAPTQPSPTAPPQREAKGAVESMQAGFQASAPGLLWRGRLPELVINPETAQWWERALSGFAQVGAELPIMIPAAMAGAPAGGAVGSAIAGPGPGTVGGSLLGAGFAMGAVPAGIRESLIQSYKSGETKTPEDWFNIVREVAGAMLKEGGINAVSMGAGGLAGRAVSKAIAPSIGTRLAVPVERVGSRSAQISTAGTLIETADLTTQIATMVAMPAALQGRLPTAQEFLDAAILVGGLKTAHVTAQKMTDVYRRTGRTPAEQVADAQADPRVAEDMLAAAARPPVDPMTGTASGVPVKLDKILAEAEFLARGGVPEAPNIRAIIQEIKDAGPQQGDMIADIERIGALHDAALQKPLTDPERAELEVLRARVADSDAIRLRIEAGEAPEAPPARFEPDQLTDAQARAKARLDELAAIEAGTETDGPQVFAVMGTPGEVGATRTMPDGSKQVLIRNEDGTVRWGDRREAIGPDGTKTIVGADKDAPPAIFATAKEARAAGGGKEPGEGGRQRALTDAERAERVMLTNAKPEALARHFGLEPVGPRLMTRKEANEIANDSAFNGDSAEGLTNIFMADEYAGKPVDLRSKGFTTAEIAGLQRAGLATDGMMTREQWQRYDAERSARLAGKSTFSPPAAAARRITAEAAAASAQRVHDDVLAQLRAADAARQEAGNTPLGDDHAQAVAALVLARVRTRAARLGMLPEEIYAENALKIRAEGEAKVAAAEIVPDAPIEAPPDAPTFMPPEVDLFGNPVPRETAPRYAVENMATVEVPLAGLVLSKEVPQFKHAADAEGVVVPLGGKFDRTGVGPIQVWERLNGAMEVISGRHRLDLARRSGEETIPAQVHREADGFDARQAAILDAQLNIREEQGSVADYVQYFKDSGITRQAADERGLLARAKGRTAFAIARDASPDLAAAHRAGVLSDEAALSISTTAPGSERLQALGMAMVQEGKSILVATNTMRAVDLMAAERMAAGKQGDIFGFDDSAMIEAGQMAKRASSIQRRIGEQISAVSGASRRPELARKMGVDVADPQGIQKRIVELKQEQTLWDNWPMHPELVARLRAPEVTGRENELMQGPARLREGEEQWFHGTRENIPAFTKGGEVYLTDRPIEAGGYALGGHLGGTGNETPRVYSIAAKKGKTLNIDALIMEEINGNGEIEVALEAGMAKARAEGARYVEFQHPSFEGDVEQNVRVSLYPAEDLRITHQPTKNRGGVLFQDPAPNLPETPAEGAARDAEATAQAMRRLEREAAQARAEAAQRPVLVRDEADGAPRLAHRTTALVEPKEWAREGDTVMYEHTVLADGREIGMLSLGWTGDQITQLHNIRTFSKDRGAGHGTAMLGAILTHNEPGTTVLLRHVIPSAREWWARRGAKFFETEEGEDGTITRADFEASPAVQAANRRNAGEAGEAQAPRIGVAGGSEGSGTPEGARQPAVGQELFQSARPRDEFERVLKQHGEDALSGRNTRVSNETAERLAKEGHPDAGTAALAAYITDDFSKFTGKNADRNPAAIALAEHLKTLPPDRTGMLFRVMGFQTERARNAFIAKVQKGQSTAIEAERVVSSFTEIDPRGKTAWTHPGIDQASIQGPHQVVIAVRPRAGNKTMAIGSDVSYAFGRNSRGVDVLVPAGTQFKVVGVQNMDAQKWVVLEPVKERTDGATLFQDDAGRPMWYSALARSVEFAQMASAPAKGWRDFLKGQTAKGAVKADEIKWSGLDEWLAMREKALEGLPLFQQHRGSFQVAENLVTIMAGADKSTVVHELSHSWLEEMKADASRPDAPAQLRADWETLRRELAIPESGEIPRASHEQFARSGERYLAEGDAPTPALQSVFARFREWLLEIYRDLRNLNVEINPDLRAVLDRMLATDEEIAAARELGVPRAYVEVAAAEQARQIVPGFKAEQVSMEPYADALPDGPGKAPDDSHVNYAYINTPLDVKLTMQRMAEIDQANIQKQRGGTDGVKSWAESNAEQAKYVNDILGGSEDTLKLLQPRDPDAPGPDVRLGILKKLAVGAAKDSARLRDIVLEAGHDATVRQQLEYMGSIERARMIQAEFLGERASVARALNALKDVTEGSGEIAKMLDAIGYGEAAARELFQAARSAADEQAFMRAKLDEILLNYKGKSVLDIARLHKEIGTLKGTYSFTKAVTQASKWEMVVEGWKASLLSGPVTHTTNLFGTGAFMALRAPVDMLAAVIGTARGASPGMGESNRASMSEAVARLTGMLGGVGEGLRVAKATFDLDDPTGKTEAYRTAIPGRAGELIRVPLRLMGAEDALVSTMYRRGELATLAIRQAFDEGLNPATREFAERVDQLKDKPTPAMELAADAAATRMTFNMPLGEKGVTLQLFVNKWNLQWMIPFIRTPINITKEVARMSPFAPLVGEWRADMAKGGVARDRAIAEMTLGSGIMALTMAYAFAGQISGGGSADPGKNRGKAGVEQPYSIKIGDTWYEYARIQPTGTLMGMAADIATAWDHMTDEEKDKVPKLLARAFANAVTNQTFLQGITNVVNAMSEPARFAPKFLQQMAGSMVPNVIGQPTVMADPVVREVNSMLEAIQARIPGLRQDLLPKRDWLGEEVKTKERLGVVGPVREQKITEDKVRLEAARLDISMAAAPKKTHIGKGTGKLGDVELTPEERNLFQKVGGEMAHRVLANIVNAPGYDDIPDLVKRKIFAKVLTASHQVAAVAALPMDKRLGYIQSISEKVAAELAPADQ